MPRSLSRHSPQPRSRAPAAARCARNPDRDAEHQRLGFRRVGAGPRHRGLLRVTPVVFALAIACTDAASDAPTETACAEAEQRTGALACVHRIDTVETWKAVSAPLEPADQARGTKYLLPARDSARLPPLFLNANEYSLHYDFLVEAFPNAFPGLTPAEYERLLFDPREPELVAGNLVEYRISSTETRLGFTIASDPRGARQLDCSDVHAAHAALRQRVYDPALSVVPSTKSELAWMESCDVPLIDPTSTLEYEAYQRGVAFGTVRRYMARELPAAIERAEFGYRDVLVLDEAPSDVETVVAAAVTGTRQGALSHLAVRSAARGTPNCFVAGAHALFADYEGKLVRVECSPTTVLVREATLDEAEAYWERLRPPPVHVPEPDTRFTELVALEDLPVESAEERRTAVGRFGAKGMNLAWLRQHLDTALTPKGFLIPVAYYADFIEENGWETDVGNGPEHVSFAATLAAFLRDERFLTDARFRRERLLALQAAMENGTCSEALMESVSRRIVEVFGSETTTVRFRSSSNAEDGVAFNGAGLYDSYSGCLADDLDDDDIGPSLCDPDEKRERGVCRALKRVWASLWNPRAYDERDFYGIDQNAALMGVLVNERSEDERANMVVFSGNPLAPNDGRFLVNAQLGELPVVSPEPGVWPEQVLLGIEHGEVSSIERVVGSSLLPEGSWVLGDAELRAIGRELARLADLYPFDVTPPKGRELLLDTEWKVMPDGSLRVKQVRPFLR